MTREQLSAIVRLLVTIGILLLMIAFLRACLSPPPTTQQPSSLPDGAPAGQGTLPGRY